MTSADASDTHLSEVYVVSAGELDNMDSNSTARAEC